MQAYVRGEKEENTHEKTKQDQTILGQYLICWKQNKKRIVVCVFLSSDLRKGGGGGGLMVALTIKYQAMVTHKPIQGTKLLSIN